MNKRLTQPLLAVDPDFAGQTGFGNEFASEALPVARPVAAERMPQKIEDAMAFPFESRFVFRPTEFAINAPGLQNDYDDCWSGFRESPMRGA